MPASWSAFEKEFPVLKHALGEEVFDAFAVGYLQQYPSRSYTLFQLGANFPRYLAETRPEASEGADLPVDWPDFLIDLATLELTFNEVFDGPGVEGEDLLDAERLRAMSPERLLEARLVGVPCLRLLVLRYPVHKYFTAVRRHEDPSPPGPAETYLPLHAGNTWSATMNSRDPPTNSSTPYLPASRWVRRSAGLSKLPAGISIVYRTTFGSGFTIGPP